MDYKTYPVSDIKLHRSYLVCKDDVARMQMALAGAVLILKKSLNKYGRNYLLVSDRTLDLLGLAIRGNNTSKKKTKYGKKSY